jgi:gamma-glutamyltranspeptidase/glutathione hydrolase
MQKKWGKLSWKELVKPAVGYARDGFPLPDKQIVEFGNKFDLVTKDPEAAKIYYPGGKVPEKNAILKNPELAKTMESLGDKGPNAFYESEIADKLVTASKKGGGSFAKEDFKNYKARELPPLLQDYKSYRIYAGAPPVTGGATATGGLLTQALSPKASAGHINKVMKRNNLRDINSKRSRSATDSGGTMARLTKIRGK